MSTLLNIFIWGLLSAIGSAQDIACSKAEKVVESAFNSSGSVLTNRNPIFLKPNPNTKLSLLPNSPVIGDIGTVWDLSKFNQVRIPYQVGKTVDPNSFSVPLGVRVLDMPIKMRSSVDDFRLPGELAPWAPVIQQIIDFDAAVVSPEVLKNYYAYLTIDQSFVESGKTQRRPGAHVDGFQGNNVQPKQQINRSYLVTNQFPTVFFPHPFDFTRLDPARHNFFLEMDRQSDEGRAMTIQPHTIYLMDAYCVHRAGIADHDGHRTFLRLSYDVYPYNRLGNTHNPAFEYDWQMKPKEIPPELEIYAAPKGTFSK